MHMIFIIKIALDLIFIIKMLRNHNLDRFYKASCKACPEWFEGISTVHRQQARRCAATMYGYHPYYPPGSLDMLVVLSTCIFL